MSKAFCNLFGYEIDWVVSYDSMIMREDLLWTRTNNLVGVDKVESFDVQTKLSVENVLELNSLGSLTRCGDGAGENQGLAKQQCNTPASVFIPSAIRQKFPEIDYNFMIARMKPNGKFTFYDEDFLHVMKRLVKGINAKVVLRERSSATRLIYNR